MSGVFIYFDKSAYDNGLTLPNQIFESSNGIKIRFDHIFKCEYSDRVLSLGYGIYGGHDWFFEINDVGSLESTLKEYDDSCAGMELYCHKNKKPRHGVRIFYKRKKMEEFTLFIQTHSNISIVDEGFTPIMKGIAKYFRASNGVCVNFNNAYNDRITADRYKISVGRDLRGKNLIVNDYISDHKILKTCAVAIQDFIDHN